MDSSFSTAQSVAGWGTAWSRDVQGGVQWYSGGGGGGGEREVATVTDCKDKCTSEMTCGYKSVSVALFAEDYVSVMLS